MDIRQVDHVELYVGDAQQMTFYLCRAFGFEVLAQGGGTDQRSVLLGHGAIRVLLTSGLIAGHPAAAYVRQHGDGVAVIGLATDDVVKAYAGLVERGARPVRPPLAWRDAGGSEVIAATVSGFGAVCHRLVQRSDGAAFLPGVIDATVPAPGQGGGSLLETIDHFAVCVPAGELAATAACYQRAFGLARIFDERIEIGAQAMDSIVVQDPGGLLTLTILAPDPAGQSGQIDDFLHEHGGAGIQHIAFRTAAITAAVAAFTERGVRFLSTPPGYYDDLERRLGRVGVPIADLRAASILVDRDHGGEMFQIFTESPLVRRTLFFELIERRGAITFGTRNIRALYEAKERERAQTMAGA
jgi:4-hydroxymandelate synthase